MPSVKNNKELTEKLYNSIIQADLTIIRELLNNENIKNEAILIAIDNNKLDIFVFIIKNMYGVNRKTHANLENIFNYVVRKGQVDILKYMIKLDLFVINESSFAESARQGHFNMVNFIITKGLVEKTFISSAFTAAAGAGEINILKPMKTFISEQKTLEDGLVLSIHNNRLDIVKYLVNEGVDVNCKNGWPLLLSVKKKFWIIFKYLIDHNADINIRYNEIIKCKLPDDIKNLVI